MLEKNRLHVDFPKANIDDLACAWNEIFFSRHDQLFHANLALIYFDGVLFLSL